MDAVPELEKRIEAVLFLENRSLVDIKVLAKKCDVTPEDVENSVQSINQRMENAGSILEIIRLENAFKLSVRADYQDDILSQYRAENKKKSPGPFWKPW